MVSVKNEQCGEFKMMHAESDLSACHAEDENRN